MKTVFSHIVQSRFSQSYEDVATDALAFILASSVQCRMGFMKLLRGIDSALPELTFRTQQADGGIRPDMWGSDGNELRVFVENKFWAGLTENQPVAYLRSLSKVDKSTILMVVVPGAREQTVVRELTARLEAEGARPILRESPPGIVYLVQSGLGPKLAVTSWDRVIHALESEAGDNPAVRGDLNQLRSLCEAADSEAFQPLSSSDVTDQRTPLLIQQLGSLIQDSVSLGVSRGAINLGGLRPQSSWNRIGRYIRFEGKAQIGVWFGLHFDLWKQYGQTPLWLVFDPSNPSAQTGLRSNFPPTVLCTLA